MKCFTSNSVSILLLHVIDERCGIDLPAGTVVIPIINRSSVLHSNYCYTVFMTSDGRIVRIRDVSMADVLTVDNVPDPTKMLYIWKSGTRWWHKNGQHHRDDGPAIEFANGTKWWYKNGQRHRDDGPAIEDADGIARPDGTREIGTRIWFKNGKRTS